MYRCVPVGCHFKPISRKISRFSEHVHHFTSGPCLLASGIRVDRATDGAHSENVSCFRLSTNIRISDQRFACRSCRFNRCANLGMVVDHTGIVSMPTPELPPHIPLLNVFPEPFAERSDEAFLCTILTVYRYLNNKEKEKTSVLSCNCRESCDRRRKQELHFAKAYDLSKSTHPTEVCPGTSRVLRKVHFSNILWAMCAIILRATEC